MSADDAAQVERTVNRYFRALDEKHFDEAHFAQLFTADARVIRPNGATTLGPADIASSHAESFTRFEATQHLLTGCDVMIDGDRADLRANLVAIHLWKDKPAAASMAERSFTAGGVVTARLVREPAGWRIVETQNRVLWRTGEFGDMARHRFTSTS